MGETRVDLQHLLEDLRDAYTGSLEETILTEVIANALDSGATRIRLLTDALDATLTIIDDGRGMQRRELARYHDIAASTKRRSESIGFAGVGIKLGLPGRRPGSGYRGSAVRFRLGEDAMNKAKLRWADGRIEPCGEVDPTTTRISFLGADGRRHDFIATDEDDPDGCDIYREEQDEPGRLRTDGR